MIRRLNFTKRKKIPRQNISIRLMQAGSGQFTFSADLQLAGLGLPDNAWVFVEAYRANIFMRFPYGEVHALATPEVHRLGQFPEKVLPLFRVKIVGRGASEGLILAVADQLVPLKPEEEPGTRISLLPVEYKDLGQRVWDLDITSQPVLVLNQGLQRAGEVARTEPSFLALAYPEIFRRILYAVLVEEEIDDPSMDPDMWQCQWLRFSQLIKGVPDLPKSSTGSPSKEDKLDWITSAVEAFCELHRATARLNEDLAQRRG
jgi:hypothetical protein